MNTKDYVSVFALHEGKVILVKQFRPSIGTEIIEIPSGHVEDGETPEVAAKKELLEETGYKIISMEFLGVLHPDTGRLGNKLWCYFTNDIEKDFSVVPEAGIEILEIPYSQFVKLVNEGEFNHALNLALVTLCATKKLIIL
ncbi:MAG: NUDIX hydrolase [Leptospiraceae bacterium]|nr:NUDIX hydrolase [Leptospiraceae bacterium]